MERVLVELHHAGHAVDFPVALEFGVDHLEAGQADVDANVGQERAPDIETEVPEIPVDDLERRQTEALQPRLELLDPAPGGPEDVAAAVVQQHRYDERPQRRCQVTGHLVGGDHLSQALDYDRHLRRKKCFFAKFELCKSLYCPQLHSKAYVFKEDQNCCTSV